MKTFEKNKVYVTPSVEGMALYAVTSLCENSVGASTENYNEFEDFVW